MISWDNEIYAEQKKSNSFFLWGYLMLPIEKREIVTINNPRQNNKSVACVQFHLLVVGSLPKLPCAACFFVASKVSE